MSVLLEALKKAAEEKKKKGSSVVGDNTTLKESAESEDSDSNQASGISSGSNNPVDSNQSGSALDSESSGAENLGDKNETSSVSLKLSPKQPDSERSDLLDAGSEDAAIQPSPTLDSSEVELDSDFESKRSPEEIEEFISPSFLKNDEAPTPEPLKPRQAVEVSENDEDLLAAATTSFDEEILSTQPENISSKTTVQAKDKDTNQQSEILDSKTSEETVIEDIAKDTEKLSENNPEQSKDVEDSYSWSMNDLPGYEDIEKSQSQTQPSQIVQNEVSLDEKVDEKSLAENPVLTKGENRRVNLVSKKSFKFNPRFLIYVGVFGLFIGIFFYALLHFQDQTQALEKSFKKYEITRIEPSAALLAKNKEALSETLPAGKENGTTKESISVNDNQQTTSQKGESEADNVDSSNEMRSEALEENAIEGIKVSGTQEESAEEVVDKKIPNLDNQRDNVLIKKEMGSTSFDNSIQQAEQSNLNNNNKEGIRVETVKAATIQKTKGLSPEKQKLKAAYKAYQQEKWALAELFFDEVVTLNPENINAQLGLAGSLLNQQKYKSALDVYYQVLGSSPKNIYAIEGIASIMQQFPNQDAQWQQTLGNVLKDYPDSAFLKSSMGNIFAQQNDWSEAQNYYFEALSLEPNNAMYNYNLAISLDYLKQYSLAIEYYTKALLYKNNQSNLDEAAIKTRLAALRLFMEKGDF